MLFGCCWVGVVIMFEFDEQKLLTDKLNYLNEQLRGCEYDQMPIAAAFIEGMIFTFRLNRDKDSLHMLSSYIRAFPNAFDHHDLDTLRAHVAEISKLEQNKEKHTIQPCLDNPYD